MSKQDQFKHNLDKLKRQRQQERESNGQSMVYDVINDTFITKDSMRS